MPGSADLGFTSENVTFLSHGVSCAATVYRPVAATGPTAAIVMGHGFGAVRALRLPAYAEHFAAAGYAVLTFDYRGFGDSAGEPRQVLDIKMQHDDWSAALDFARCLDGVDPNRLVAWGTSFAGGHVLTLAGRGEPLAAVIAQVPHVSGPAAVRSAGLRAAVGLAPLALRDLVRTVRGGEPVFIPCIGTPGQAAAMTSSDAVAGLARLEADSGFAPGQFRSDVAARIVARLGAYSPGRFAGSITCPVLVQIAERDAITPASVARRTAGRIKQATVRSYDCGHFDPYVEPLFSTVVSDQLAFLTTHVPPTTRTA
ncbi:alpha/beta hydrolase [Nocardioides sp. zg-536]|uniref:Alpha/beta hydrolase n=1 Tax=Nocardioides faecalis TaxID=2803858 RepID=A0A939BSZ5_9ACTN|nr:alpha/beta hydrolase [Nocardioides faecalis]MBM9460134.1 alpha/beta hydrolase [Nocardioides faecalis]QVI60071.1 alpha/beta hydrolase [Nocardioides faecalis]